LDSIKIYTALGSFFILLLGVAIYSNTFSGSFHLDDPAYIVGNEAIRNMARPWELWGYFPTRFIAFITFALNYHFQFYFLLKKSC
jgi:hypothetical protein